MGLFLSLSLFQVLLFIYTAHCSTFRVMGSAHGAAGYHISPVFLSDYTVFTAFKAPDQSAA